MWRSLSFPHFPGNWARVRLHRKLLAWLQGLYKSFLSGLGQTQPDSTSHSTATAVVIHQIQEQVSALSWCPQAAEVPWPASESSSLMEQDLVVPWILLRKASSRSQPAVCFVLMEVTFMGCGLDLYFIQCQ